MEKKRNDLKVYSILVLVFVLISLGRMIADVCINGFGDIGQLPEGVTESVANVALVVVWVIGIIFLLPQIYIGIAGLKQAKNPTSGRAHIVWAFILTALSALSLISCIVDITKVYTFDKLLTTLDTLVNVILFTSYYVVARQIAAEVK